ncbi:MAG: hypothetical protein AAF791_14055 [Bacteroidota bacterium]
MRNIAFSLTTPQFRDRTKTVTRRNGWLWLVEQNPTPEAPVPLMGIVKGMGLKRGERVERLGPIAVTSATRETLRRMLDDEAYGRSEVVREGFPHLTPAEFVAFYCRHNRITPDVEVTRIEFLYRSEHQANDAR